MATYEHRHSCGWVVDVTDIVTTHHSESTEHTGDGQFVQFGHRESAE